MFFSAWYFCATSLEYHRSKKKYLEAKKLDFLLSIIFICSFGGGVPQLIVRPIILTISCSSLNSVIHGFLYMQFRSYTQYFGWSSRSYFTATKTWLFQSSSASIAKNENLMESRFRYQLHLNQPCWGSKALRS